MIKQHIPQKIRLAIYPAAILLISVIANGSFVAQGFAQSEQSIVVLINDEPISAFDINQRIKFSMARKGAQLSANMKKKLQSEATRQSYKDYMVRNRPQSREEVKVLRDKFIGRLRSQIMNEMKPKFYKAALDELIEEKLVIQEAKKVGAKVSDEDVDKAIAKIASRNINKKTGTPNTSEQFLGKLKRAGISVKTYKASLKAKIAMQNIIRKKYGFRMRSMITAKDVDQALGGLPNNAKNTEFRLQKVSLSVPSGADQSTLARRLVEAETLRSQFTSCEQIETLAKPIGATVLSLGKRTTKQMPQTSRMMLQEAKTGEMTPPDITDNGIELYAVCNRREVKGDSKERKQIENELKSKEVAILKKRYMRDLRQDAFIEYRDK
ncbi:MAG: SurA N-terminal domain-containing protein [Pseudomonadota bacterium]